MTNLTDPTNNQETGSPEPTELAALGPGDALDIWAEGDRIVTSVLWCKETVADRSYAWRWIFLDDGSLIEVSPDGYFWYREHQIVKQGSGLFEALAAQDGALVRFESYVRAGSSSRRPVLVTFGEREYRIASTGTVAVQRWGEAPGLIPWSSFSSKSEENVYFGLVDVENENNVGLGLWTAHICLSFGHPFDPSDVTAVFHRGSPGR